MTATGGTALKEGGNTIQTNKGNLLDDLFERMVLVQAGATVLNGLVGNLDIPRLNKDATGPVKKTENQQSGELSPTTSMLSLSPKRLPAVIEVSNQLMKQSSERALEAVLKRHLESHISQVMQRALLHGGGTAEPVGIAGTTGIGSVAGGTNGAAPDYADIVNLQREVAIDDADFGRLAFVTNAKVEAKLKLTPKVASTDSMTLIDSYRNISTLDGRPYYITNSVSSTLIKAGSGSVCSAIFFGNWNDLWIANWGGIEFLVNPFSKDDYGLTSINAAVYYDGGVVRPVSFAAMLDALT
jgi:HK97 family phage major capsid protein